ncbi:Hypothetical protein GLP15_3888 [Giardia lamblia P15]|uniref:Uncharacterized protein n=1 Tax=Giardia intestinalis (strain P15) TaxID=658858 RepID=E1F0L7_GIAIA|nr:Hypothetical protein GLP15_3888 [Giardia lamblia P15]
MLASIRQTAEELLNLVGSTIKDDLDSLSLLDAVVDAQTQSPRSFYAYLLLNEKCDMIVPLRADNEYMPPVLATILLSTLSKEIDEILDDTSFLWPVAVDFLYSFVESCHVPLGIFHTNYRARNKSSLERRTSLFKSQQSLVEYLHQVRSHRVQSRWFLILFQTCSTFRWILGMIISAFLLGSAEESVHQMGAISNNPSIHYDFTGIEFYSFKELEERFCQTCITKHRASSQARRAKSRRNIRSTKCSQTLVEAAQVSRASSAAQTPAAKSRANSPQPLERSRANSTAPQLCLDSSFTTTDLECNENQIYSTRLQLTLTPQPSDLSLSLAELLHALERKAKKQGYLSILKSGFQSILSSAPREQQWRLPPITLLSVFEPFCNLCMDGEQRPYSESLNLTYLTMKRLEIQSEECWTWKARTLNFNPDCDKVLLTMAATRYYDRFGEYLYAMDRKLAKFNLAPVLLGPVFYGYKFFIDRSLIVEKLKHWNTITLSKLLKTTSIDGIQSSDMALFASSGSKKRIHRQVPLEFVPLQLLLTVLQQWTELKGVLFDSLSTGVEKAFIQEFEHTIILHTFTPIEDFIRSAIEMCPLLQQHIPTLVLLSNALEVLEQRFLTYGVDARESMLSIKVYILKLIETQLEVIYNDFQLLLKFKYNQLHSRHVFRNKTNHSQSFTDLIAQPEAYSVGCLFETILSLQLSVNLKESNSILYEYSNRIIHLLKQTLNAFFEYGSMSAQLILSSEVDQLVRQLSECHILCTLMNIGTNYLDTAGHIATAVKQRTRNLFAKLCTVLIEKGVTTKADQLEYLRTLKRSHMIHKQLLIKLEHIDTA